MSAESEISAPVLVYERPQFTEAMFAKARDSPLTPRGRSKSKSLPHLLVGKSSSSKMSSTASSATCPNQGGVLRRLSSRARSVSSFRRESMRSDSSGRSKSHSIRDKVSRRLSRMWFRSASFSEGSSSAKTNANDELIVYVEEQ